MNVYLVHYKQSRGGEDFSKGTIFVEASSASQAKEKTIKSLTHDFFNVSVEILYVEFKWREDNR